MRGTSRTTRLVYGILPVLGGLAVVWWGNAPRRSEAAPRTPPQEELLARALERSRAVAEYSCVLEKQERVGGELKERQTLRVRCRVRPLRIHLCWLENASDVHQALYVRGRNRSADGREQVLVEPAGTLARALNAKVAVPIDGEEARAASRYRLDQYGFAEMLERVLRESRLLAEAGVIEWEPIAESAIGGRPTYRLERRHRPGVPPGEYPKPVLILHIDQEWLVPVALRAYGDAEGTNLLEDYICTEVVLDPGLSDADFQL